MRLLMFVHKASYDYTYTNVVPIEYTDKEQFLVDLELAFHYWNDQRSELQAKLNEHAKILASINRIPKQKEYYSENIKPASAQLESLNEIKELSVGINKILIDHIYEYGYGYLQPEIYTVDEFFQKAGK